MNRLLAAFAALTSAAVSGCWGSGGCHITAHCEDDELHACEVDNDTGAWESTTNCAADGRVCRQGAGAPACVFADQPCAADACAGDRVARCTTLGLVTSYTDCAREEPGRTCFAGRRGPTCGYPAIDCPSSGADTLCGPDGVSEYSGCSADAHPLHRTDCSASSGDVCVTAGALVDCAGPAMIPCKANSAFCSDDLTHAYFCGSLGLVSLDDDCAARGQACRDGSCVNLSTPQR
jgi:hypothetical protein